MRNSLAGPVDDLFLIGGWINGFVQIIIGSNPPDFNPKNLPSLTFFGGFVDSQAIHQHQQPWWSLQITTREYLTSEFGGRELW